MRSSEEVQTTTNRKAFNRLYKRVECQQDGRCTICGWHRGENLKQARRHGVRKPSKKDHR